MASDERTAGRRASARDWRPITVGAVGGAASLALAPLAHADGPACVAAAFTAAAVGLLLARPPRVRQEGVEPRAPDPAAPPFVAALEALPDPFVIVAGGERAEQATRRVAFANRAARELMRVPREGSPLFSAIRRPEILEAVDVSLYERRSRAVNYASPGANERFWRVTTTPLDADVDGPRFALLHLRDETDARRAERTRVDFLANASHELRTPLASLSGFIETLRGHAREDPVARDRFLAIMAAQTERMGRLTEDLLSLSRVELNEHVPPSGRCDLSQAVTDVADALGPLVAERGVALELKLPARGEATIVGERDQLVQVVQNLVTNAIKYSPREGSVALTVDIETDPEAGSPTRAAGSHRVALLTPDRVVACWAVLRVRDAGPGMQRQHLSRLAERFYRIEGQKSGERAGTGLGLAIVKHIVNRHRGGLVVESAPGRGAVFTAYFPYPDAAAARTRDA